jgi:hypothetical protein
MDGDGIPRQRIALASAGKMRTLRLVIADLSLRTRLMDCRRFDLLASSCAADLHYWQTRAYKEA